MAAPSIGQRDVWVQIQSRASADTGGSSGFPVEDFDDLGAKVAMHRRPMRGSERFASAQISASADHEWRMPYQSNMDPDLVDVPKLRRLVYQNRIYDIQSAQRDTFEEGDGILMTTLARSGS